LKFPSPLTDKRPINGAAFVCFSKELMVLGDQPQLEEILTYTENVLRAVGFKNGAIHGEIMYTARGPVLVELNCRLHGGNAAWVRPANLCMGYDQLSVFMDSYLNEGKALYNIIPARPERARAYCQQVKMRSFVEGTLECVIPEQWARVTSLPSYLEHTFGVLPGDEILKTRDMPSVPGEVTLVHSDKAQLAKDYEELNNILLEGIFQVKQD
jgi:biotin carboxylase